LEKRNQLINNNTIIFRCFRVYVSVDTFEI